MSPSWRAEPRDSSHVSKGRPPTSSTPESSRRRPMPPVRSARQPRPAARCRGRRPVRGGGQAPDAGWPRAGWDRSPASARPAGSAARSGPRCGSPATSTIHSVNPPATRRNTSPRRARPGCSRRSRRGRPARAGRWGAAGRRGRGEADDGEPADDGQDRRYRRFSHRGGDQDDRCGQAQHPAGRQAAMVAAAMAPTTSSAPNPPAARSGAASPRRRAPLSFISR